MKKINITNGEYFNSYLQEILGETCIPFNEAMIEGKICYPLFTNEFTKERAKTHQVTEQYYLDNGKLFLDLLHNVNRYNNLILWFGEDMFCQINLLCLMELLYEKSFTGVVTLNLINDHTREIKYEKELNLKKYHSYYQSVVNKENIDKCDKVLRKAINNYYAYKNEKFEIINYIEKNIDLENHELVNNILQNMNDDF